MTKLISYFSIITLAVVVLAASTLLLFLRPVSENFSEIAVEIKKGDSFNQIAEQLKEQKVIKSVKAFKVYSILSGSAHILKPGNYILNAASSTPEIVKRLALGPENEQEILIPEGLSLRDIDDKLSERAIFPKESLLKFDINKVKNDYEFLKSVSGLEGYLFPDTYRFFKNSEPITAIKKFLDNFNEKIWPLIKGQEKTIGNTKLGPKELLVVASMIEKEIPANVGSDDRALVAGILYKRLKLGMPLQVDATVVYAKCKGSFAACGQLGLFKIDFSAKSPYNTYLYKGLPPAPISNPGVDAAKSALNPKDSEYLYYLSDPKTKQTIFSKGLDEHTQNRVKYIGI